jgi:hypothetical protein
MKAGEVAKEATRGEVQPQDIFYQGLNTPSIRILTKAKGWSTPSTPKTR